MIRMNRSAALIFASACSLGCADTLSPADVPPADVPAADASPEVGACSPVCGTARTCCGGRCVNTANDPFNCGGCGVVCGGSTPYCNGSGACRARPCSPDAGACAAGTTCCGDTCCAATELCCDPQGPLDRGPACLTAVGSPPSCPPGCAPLCISDRNLKRDVRPVDDGDVLERVAHMPVSSWSYTFGDPSVRHMGPMAQDFYSAFGLGSTDRAYDPVDAHGVTFAAIRGLYARLQEQTARVDRLEAENARLRAAQPLRERRAHTRR